MWELDDVFGFIRVFSGLFGGVYLGFLGIGRVILRLFTYRFFICFVIFLISERF